MSHAPFNIILQKVIFLKW